MRAFAAVLCAAMLAGCANAPARQQYRVVRVIDGDTLIVQDDSGLQTRIRLRRVNAPELGAPGGEEARRALAEQFEGRTVYVTPYARDAYGRTVGEIAPVSP